MNSAHFYGVSAFFNALFAFFLVYTVYLRNGKNPLNQSFLFFGISVAGWSFIYALWAWAQNAHLAEYYLRRHMMFEAFIPATTFHFICEFTHNSKKLDKWITLAYGLAIIYSGFMLTPWMIAGVRKIMFFEYWPAPGPMLVSHVIYFCILICASFYLLIHRFQHSSGIEKKQTLIMFLALAMGFGGGSINWLLWFDILVPPTTNFFVGVMFAMVAYAMIRHGLMDLDQVLEQIRSSRAATLGLIASSINHELRNPLYIAQGSLENLLEKMQPGNGNFDREEQEKNLAAVKRIHHNLDRALGIMTRISSFAKPSKISRVEITGVHQSIENVLQLVASEMQDRRIQILQEPMNGLTLSISGQDFEEILLNLVMNAAQALKLSPEGLIKISAATNDQKRVEIYVEDNGPGIAPERLRRIFDPFYTTRAEGSGLGLYITKQLVERNAGKISIKSKVGKGTSFKLEFPENEFLRVTEMKNE